MSGDFPHVLSTHAARVVAERGIPLAWIARTVVQPERVESDKSDPQLRHALARVPEHEGRVLRVVYNPTVEPWRIVTVYFDRAMRRRL